MVQRPHSIKTHMEEIEITCKMQLEVQNALLRVCESKIEFNSNLRVFGLVTISVDGRANDMVIRLSKDWMKDNKSARVTPPIMNATFTPIAPAPTSKHKKSGDRNKHDNCIYKSIGMCPSLCPDHNRKKSHYRSRTAPEQYHKLCEKQRRDSSAPSPIRRSAFITPNESTRHAGGTLSAPCYMAASGTHSARKRIVQSVGKRFQALRQASRDSRTIENGTTPVSRYQSTQDKVLPRRSIAQCLGITKNKKLTYSAEDKKDQEQGTFACTLQRLLPRHQMYNSENPLNKIDFYNSQESLDYKDSSTDQHKEDEHGLNTAILLTPPLLLQTKPPPASSKLPVTPLPLLSPLSPINPHPFMPPPREPSPPTSSQPSEPAPALPYNTPTTAVGNHSAPRVLITDFDVLPSTVAPPTTTTTAPPSPTVSTVSITTMDASMLSVRSTTAADMHKLKSDLIGYDEETVYLETNTLQPPVTPPPPALKSLAAIRFKSRRSIGTPNLLQRTATDDDLKENEEKRGRDPAAATTTPGSKFAAWPKSIFKSITSSSSSKHHQHRHQRTSSHFGLISQNAAPTGGVNKQRYRRDSPASKGYLRRVKRSKMRRSELKTFASDI